PICCCRSRPSLGFVLAFQLISGLASGTFIPLTIGFVVLKPAAADGDLRRRRLCAEPRAVAQHRRLGQGLVQRLLVMALDLLGCRAAGATDGPMHPLGMPRHPINRELIRSADWSGLLYAALGFSLIYAALDQGNRLDWLNSRLINALLLGGTVLLAAF